MTRSEVQQRIDAQAARIDVQPKPEPAWKNFPSASPEYKRRQKLPQQLERARKRVQMLEREAARMGLAL